MAEPTGRGAAFTHATASASRPRLALSAQGTLGQEDSANPSAKANPGSRGLEREAHGAGHSSGD